MLFSTLWSKHKESSKPNCELNSAVALQQQSQPEQKIPLLETNETNLSSASITFLDTLESSIQTNNFILNEYLLSNSEKRDRSNSNKFENNRLLNISYSTQLGTDFYQSFSLQGTTILGFFQTNNTMLNNIVSMIDSTNKDITFLRKTVADFKTEVESKPEPQQPLLISSSSKKISKQYKNDSPSFRSLANHLIGVNKSFPFELSLKNRIPKVLNKGKNFVLNIQLVDSVEKKPFKNQNKIILRIALYTWQIPSTVIMSNKKGNHALTGQHEVELINGEATFTSLQINEVTSKFINRVVAIMIVPDKPRNQGATLKSSIELEDDSALAYHKIKPFLSEKISVKSLKKKYLDKLED